MKTVFLGLLASVTFAALAEKVPPYPKMGEYRLAQTFSEAANAQVKLHNPARPPERQEEKEVKYNYSIGFGGWSNHKKKFKCVKARCYGYQETNPTIEFDVWLDVELLGGRPFIGYGHVIKNSNGGKTDWLIAANQWKLIRGEYVDMVGGLGAMVARYSVPKHLVKPGTSNSKTEVLPAVYLGLEKGLFAARFVPLGKDILFLYLIYSFR